MTEDRDEFHTFSLRLPAALNAQLREAAQRHDRSQGAEVRHLLRAALAHELARTEETHA